MNDCTEMVRIYRECGEMIKQGRNKQIYKHIAFYDSNGSINDNEILPFLLKMLQDLLHMEQMIEPELTEDIEGTDD
jgi:hypothetical protein